VEDASKAGDKANPRSRRKEWKVKLTPKHPAYIFIREQNVTTKYLLIDHGDHWEPFWEYSEGVTVTNE
jgi:hypothetical protein